MYIYASNIASFQGESFVAEETPGEGVPSSPLVTPNWLKLHSDKCNGGGVPSIAFFFIL